MKNFFDRLLLIAIILASSLSLLAQNKTQLGITNFEVVADKVYDADRNATFNLDYELVGVNEGDWVDLDIDVKYDNANVGYGKTITIHFEVIGFDKDNYIAPPDSVIYGSITKRQLEIKADPKFDPKTYDGNTNVSITTEATLKGIQGSDNISVTSTCVYDNKMAGTRKIVYASFAISGNAANNYIAPLSKRLSGTILKKEIHVAGTRIDTAKTYDGTDDCRVLYNGVLTDTLIGNDVVTFTAVADYDDPNVGNNKPVYVKYLMGGTDGSNYKIPEDSANFRSSILAKQLRASVKVTVEKMYDGHDGATVGDTIKLFGVIQGDTVRVSSCNASYDNPSVDTGKTITVTYTIGGPDFRNYKAPVDSLIFTGKIKKRSSTADSTTVAFFKEYDGTDTATVANPGTLQGILRGDNVTLVAEAFYSDSAAGTDKNVVIIYRLVGPDAGNYDVPSPVYKQGYTIFPKKLTAGDAVIDATKEYDGTTNAVVSQCADVFGVIGNDVVTLECQANYSTSNVGNGKAVTVTFVPQGAAASNYTAPDPKTYFADITPRKLRINTPTVEGTKEYDGNTDVKGQPVAGSFRNLVSGDDVTAAITAVYDSAQCGIGTRKIYVAYELEGEDKGNYIKPDPDTLRNQSIERKTPKVSGLSLSKNKTYDGTTTAQVFNSGSIMVYDNDNVTLRATANYDDKNVGNSKPIIVEFTISGPDAGNYNTPEDTVVYGKITPRNVKVDRHHAVVESTKIYDGTTNCRVVTQAQLDTFCQGDNIYVASIANYRDINIGTSKGVDVTYKLQGNDSANYTMNNNYTEAHADITPRQLYVRDPEIQTSKMYDLTRDATVIYNGDLFGHIEGVDDHLILTDTALYDTPDVGDNKKIFVSYGISGPGATNYYRPKNDTLLGCEITDSRLTVSGTEVQSTKVYDGTTSIQVTALGTLHGLTDRDQVSLALDTAYYNTPEVGDTKSVTVKFRLIGPDAQKYIVPAPLTTLKAQITKKNVRVSGSSTFQAKQYNGQSNVTVLQTGSLNGVVAGDTLILAASAVAENPNAGTNIRVFVSYQLQGPDESNYFIENPQDSSSTINITPSPLSVYGATLNPEKVFDGTAQANVVSIDSIGGRFGNDNVQVVATANYTDPFVNSGKTIDITYELAGTASTNYTAPSSSRRTDGVITPAPVTVTGTIVDQSKVYNGNLNANVSFAGTLSGFSSFPVTLTATARYTDKNVGSGIPVKVAYSLSGYYSSNFLVPDTAILYADITPKPVTAAGAQIGNGKPYDGTVAATVVDSGYITGLVAGDDVTVVATAHFDTPDAGTGKPVDVFYQIEGDDAGNYTLSNRHDTIFSSINQKALTVSGTTVDLTKVYDATTSCRVSNNGLLQGVCGSDNVQVYATARYVDKNAGSNKYIIISYHYVGADSANYAPLQDVTIENGVINPATVTITGTTLLGNVKVYDGNINATVGNPGQINTIFAGDSVVLVTTATFTDPNTGYNKPIVLNYNLQGIDAGNYNVALVDTMYGDIVCKHVTVAGTTVNGDKVYDGSSEAVIKTLGHVVGLVNSDIISVSAVAHYDNLTPGNNRRVIVSYHVSGPDSANYCIADDTLGNVYTISKAPLTMNTFSLIDSKMYDGNDVAQVTVGDPAGIVGGDNIHVAATANYDNKNVGTGKAITIIYTLSGNDSANYEAPHDTTIYNGVITEAPISVSGIQVEEWKTFDSTTVAKVLANPVLTGVLPGDVVLVNAAADYDTPDAGTAKLITVTYTTSGADAMNYASLPSESYSNNGIIFEPVILASAEIGSDIRVVTEQADYCEGDDAYLNYIIHSGNPYQYRLEFTNAGKAMGFEDVEWAEVPSDIMVHIPDSCDDGIYVATLQFRNALQARDSIMNVHRDTVYIKVNVSNRFVTDIFEDVVSIDNRTNRFHSYQWYKDDVIIPDANLPYYQEKGGLNGVYYVVVNLGEEDEAKICPREFRHKSAGQQAKIAAYPNPVQDELHIHLENFAEGIHHLVVVNANGLKVIDQNFEGDLHDIQMGGFPTGIYTVLVDGISVKAIKK